MIDNHIHSMHQLVVNLPKAASSSSKVAKNYNSILSELVKETHSLNKKECSNLKKLIDLAKALTRSMKVSDIDENNNIVKIELSTAVLEFYQAFKLVEVYLHIKLGQTKKTTVCLGDWISHKKQIAVKIVNKSSSFCYCMNEVEISKLITHKNLIKFLGEFNLESSYIFLHNLCPYGDVELLVNKLRSGLMYSENHYRLLNLKTKGILKCNLLNLSFSLIYFLFRQIFEASDYLHKRGVVHRDIKLSNIMIESSSVLQLSDLELSLNLKNKNGNDKMKIERHGTTAYMGSDRMIDSIRINQGYLLDYMLLGKTAFFMLYDPKKLKDLESKMPITLGKRNANSSIEYEEDNSEFQSFVQNEQKNATCQYKKEILEMIWAFTATELEEREFRIKKFDMRKRLANNNERSKFINHIQNSHSCFYSNNRNSIILSEKRNNRKLIIELQKGEILKSLAYF